MPDMLKKRIKEYQDFIKKYFPPVYLKAFKDRLSANVESAHVEVVCWLTLKKQKIKVDALESQSRGGPDFICSSHGKVKLIVEATSLNSNAVSNASEMPDSVSSDSFNYFQDIGKLVRTKLSDKARQVANHKCPRVVFIGSEHLYSGILLADPTSVKDFFTSRTTIKHPIGAPSSNLITTTNLAESIFFRRNKKNGEFETCRKSISAVLLASVKADKTQILGLLHPDPAFPLDVELLPQIPFLRAKKWPFASGKIITEWVIGRPKPYEFTHNLW